MIAIDLLRYAWWRLSNHIVVSGKVVSGDAVIHYQIVGTGSPLIMLHGGLSSSLDWYAEIPALAATFQLVLIDLRGHGGSTRGTQSFTYQLRAKDVFLVFDSLSLSRVSVMGWSDGGNIGLMMAKDQPQRIVKLLAISANAFPEGLTEDARLSIYDIDPEKPTLLRRLMYRWQSPDPTQLSALVAEVVHMWRHYPSLTISELQELSTPTLLIIGENDDVALHHALDMQTAMPNASLSAVPKVGHNVPQAGAAVVIEKVLDFLC